MWKVTNKGAKKDITIKVVVQSSYYNLKLTLQYSSRATSYDTTGFALYSDLYGGVAL